MSGTDPLVLLEGDRAEVYGLRDARYNGKLVVLGNLAPGPVPRFEVPELNIRLKLENLRPMAEVEKRHDLSLGVNSAASGVERCAWCRADLDAVRRSVCTCEMRFCHACHFVARNAGHALLCRKKLILCKIGERATVLVRTLPRSDETLLETARALFGGAADRAPTPGSGVVCMRVTPPTGGRSLPYRFAVVLGVPSGSGVSIEACREALVRCLDHMHTCSIAVRTNVSPFLRDAAMPAGREMSISLFTGSTVEHVLMTYTPVSSTGDAVAETVALEGAVYDGEMKAPRAPRSELAFLTPEYVDPIAHGLTSPFLRGLHTGRFAPPGAKPGGVAALTNVAPSLLRAWRLEAYDEARREWTVSPVQWSDSERDYVPSKAGARVASAAHVSVDCVVPPRGPRLFRTTWRPGASGDDVALMVYATLPLRVRDAPNLRIVEKGRERAYELKGMVALPMPLASYDARQLRRALTEAGEPDAIEGECAGRAAALLSEAGRTGRSAVTTPQMVDLDASASKFLECRSRDIDSANMLHALSIVRAADLLPSTHVLLLMRTEANTNGFMHLQISLTASHMLAAGRGGEVKQAAWMAFRGGDDVDGESTFTVGRPTHSLDVARRMIAENRDEGGECALCLEPLLGSACDSLTCGHMFHLECLRDLRQAECALCRTPVRLQFGKHADGRDGFDDLDLMDMCRLRLDADSTTGTSH
jgi:hypothetical protein